MNRILTLILILVLTINTQAQSPKYRVLSIPVTRNGLQMRDPWLGGFDSPQFSNCDLNQDGIPDLFVFDRVGNKVYTYLGNGSTNTDTMFTYAPQYEKLFPALNNWAVIRDYNLDGVPDIFTHTGLGTMVYKGTRVNGLLHFNLVSKYLKYTQGIFTRNIFTNIADLPAIVDVNGDGDMDILTYDQFGSAIAYYENQTMENQGNPSYVYDSLPYQLVTSCWCKALQSLINDSMQLNVDTSVCQYGIGIAPPDNGGDSRHSGNSLYPVRDPYYNTIDILNGNVGFDNLSFLRNDGKNGPNGNCYEWDSVFPLCGHPMVEASYPAASGLYISSNTTQDILMSPNGYPPYDAATYPSRNVKNVSYYKSSGDTTCWYDFQNDSFLVHHMLDFGTNSKPVFYDYNGDGLQDIIVGNYGYFDSLISPPYQSAMAYYQNTGTATNPKYTEITTDADNFGQYHLLAVSPAFGDLDGDGKPDMLVGDVYGNLYYFRNAATTGSSYPSMTSSSYFHIQVAQFAAPYIYDVNGDSLPDLVIGRLDGGLSYYWNYGTKQNPQFNPDSVNLNFGNVDVTPYGQAYGYSNPFIYKGDTGQLKLLVGSGGGTVYSYTIDPLQLKTTTTGFALLDSNYIKQSVGLNATISVADINGDGLNEYLLGTATGGIMMYSDSLWDPSTVLGTNDPSALKSQLLIYPNPAKESFICTFDNTGFVNPKTEIYNLLGQQLFPDIQFADGKVLVNTSGMTKDFYIVRITDGDKTCTGKVILN